MREAERELARQAELAYQRTVADWQSTKGRERDTGTRITKALEGQAARQGISPKPCALAVVARATTYSRKQPPTSPDQLDFHPSSKAAAGPPVLL